MSRKGAGFGIWGSHNLTPVLVSVRGMEGKITGMVVALLTSLPWLSMGVGIAWVSVRKQYTVAESIEHFLLEEAESTEYSQF